MSRPGESVDLIDTREVLLLDVGSGNEGTAAYFFPEAAIERMDADAEFNPDFVHDIREPFPEGALGKYEVLFLSHVLEHIERSKVGVVLANLKSALKDGGELWIIVPSLEWVGRELTKDKPSPVTLAAIYGSQTNEWQYHKSGYTLYLLRQLIMKSGMIARQAYQGPFTVTMNGKDYPSLQNIMVAMRHDESDHTLQSDNGVEEEDE